MSSSVHAVGHLVRRGVIAAQDHIAGISPAVIEKLQHDAELYEKEGKEVNLWEVVPIVVTVVFTLLLVASIR